MRNALLHNIYYGWKNLAGSFICAGIAIGFTSYIYGMFAIPVGEEFGISRADYNNGMIAFMVGLVVMSPVVGHMLDNYSVRRMMMTGGVIFSASLLAIASLDNLWIMLLIIALPLTFGTASTGIISANTVTVRWFKNRRGRALGVLALSTSVGGFLIQPLTAVLIENLGWRGALFTLGGISLLAFTVLGARVIRDRPSGSEQGYEEEFSTSQSKAHNDSDTVEESVNKVAGFETEKAWGKGELFRSRNFWLLSICMGVMFGVDQAVLVSQVPFFQDIGFDLTTAAILVSIKTISAIAGKLMIGFLADRVDLRILFTVVASCNATLMAIYITEPQFWVLATSVALLGVAVGGMMPVWTTMIAWLFGARSYGTVMGMTSVIMQPFAIVTLRFAGTAYDSTGSYTFPFTVFVGLALIAIALAWMVKPPQTSSE